MVIRSCSGNYINTAHHHGCKLWTKSYTNTNSWVRHHTLLGWLGILVSAFNIVSCAYRRTPAKRKRKLSTGRILQIRKTSNVYKCFTFVCWHRNIQWELIKIRLSNWLSCCFHFKSSYENRLPS